MVLEETIGLLTPIKITGSGLDIVHEICNFTYKWRESEWYLRRDICRLLSILNERKVKNNEEEIAKKWFISYEK